MTEPLVPPDVDLRGMSYMPLFGDRLFKSTTWIEASCEARCAALQLWWHAFAHEVPAASLPDNERVLADHAGLGLKAFRRARAQAMRGWVKCSDGRFYHPVVADVALEAWSGRVRIRERVRKHREKFADVTVTDPLRNGRKRESKREGEGKGLAAAAAAPDAIDRAFAAWQEAAAREGWPEVMFLNSVRRWKLGQRLAECGGPDGWQAALAAASDAGFLKAPDGSFHRWFDLDWLLDEQKFTRLLEGRYAQRHRHRSADAGSGLDAALAELGRAGAAPGRE
jgi:uncharacterized protein DUF1376